MSEVNAWVMVPRGVDKVIDREATRYSLGCAVISPSNNGVFLAATNGRIATITQCVGQSDGNYLVPNRVLEKKAGIAKMNGQWEIEQKKGRKNWEKALVPSVEPDNQRFPALKDVMQVGNREEVCVRFDAKLLLQIAEAINDSSTGVTLLIDKEKPDQAIRVVGDTGVGLLMGLEPDKKDIPGLRYNGFIDTWAQQFNTEEIRQRYMKPDKK